MIKSQKQLKLRAQPLCDSADAGMKNIHSSPLNVRNPCVQIGRDVPHLIRFTHQRSIGTTDEPLVRARWSGARGSVEGLHTAAAAVSEGIPDGLE